MKLNFLKAILKNDNMLNGRFANAILLSASQLFSLLFSFISILIIAKENSLQNFGILSICLTIYSIIAIFSECGFFSNVGTSLSKNKFKDSDLFGFTILISIALSIIFLLLLCLSFPIIGIFYQNDIQFVLIGSGLLSFSFLLPYAMPFIFSGSEKIKIFSLFNFVNNLLYFLFIVMQVYYFKNHNLSWYINLKSVSILISIILIFILLKPTFLNQLAILNSIFQDWKNFGFHCFVGRLYNSTIPFLLVLIVGYVLSEKSAAIFRVSFNFINPLLLIFLSFTQSMAKKVSNMPEIPKSIFYSNLFISILLVIFSGIGCFILIEFFLGDKYKQSFPLFLIMLICCLLYGNYRMYYEWLVLNGHGKKVMNASKYAFLFIVIFSFPLLKIFDIYGASFALVGSFSVCTIFVLYYYRSVLKENIYGKKQEILDTCTK